MIEKQLREWQAAEQAALDAEYLVKQRYAEDGPDAPEALVVARSLRTRADELLRAIVQGVDGDQRPGAE